MDATLLTRYRSVSQASIFMIHVYSVLALTPRSLAAWATDWPDSIAGVTAFYLKLDE